MSKNNQEKPSGKASIPKPTSKAIIGAIKGGRIVSEAPPKPQKPTKGNK